jgi:putative aldouronate transport system permease protein
MIKSKRSRIEDLVIAFICSILIITCLLPMLNILARSLSSSEAIIRNEVLLWPKGLNLEAYRFVLSDAKYTWSLLWTAILTVICTIVAMTMTTICAYPLIYDKLKGRRFFNTELFALSRKADKIRDRKT